MSEGGARAMLGSTEDGQNGAVERTEHGSKRQRLEGPAGVSSLNSASTAQSASSSSSSPSPSQISAFVDGLQDDEPTVSGAEEAAVTAGGLPGCLPAC